MADGERERKHWTRPKRCPHGFLLGARLCAVFGCPAASATAKPPRVKSADPAPAPAPERTPRDEPAPKRSANKPLLLRLIELGEKLDELEAERDRAARWILEQLAQFSDAQLPPAETGVLKVLRGRADALVTPPSPDDFVARKQA